MKIEESSITLNFPDNNYFRFQECKGYKDIQNNFKEMDACWYDETKDELYLIELKDWKNNNLEEENDSRFSEEEVAKIKQRISKFRIGTLFKKSVDSLCMILSVMLETGYSENINNCFSFTITKKTKIKLLSIINWEDTDVTYISSVNSAYKSKFGSYAKLFGIRTFIVLTKERAKTQFDWVE
jgi:hypothetical protein